MIYLHRLNFVVLSGYNSEMTDPEMSNFGRHLRKYTVRLLPDYKVEFIERFLEK